MRTAVAVAILSLLYFAFPIQGYASEAAAKRVVERFFAEAAELIEDHSGGADQSEIDRFELSGRLKAIFIARFDILTISQTVLGVTWRRSTADQRQAFQKAFVLYLSDKYSARFPDFIGNEFDVLDAYELKENQYRVPVLAKISADLTFTSDWYVLRRSGRSRIVNVVVDGTDLLRIERNVIRSLLGQRGGSIDRLTEYLPTRYRDG